MWDFFDIRQIALHAFYTKIFLAFIAFMGFSWLSWPSKSFSSKLVQMMI